MAIFQRLRDVAYAGFFLVHLGAALLFDTQLIFDRKLFPTAIVDLLNNYVKEYKDPLVGNNPVWLRSILYLEVIGQVPFLLVGFFGALLGARWMRTPSIIYGTSVVTMALPMVAHVLFEDFKGFKVGPTKPDERLALAGIYGGFLLAGLTILLDNLFFRSAGKSGQNQVKFSENNKTSQKKKN